MENKLSTRTEGEKLKSAAQVVGDVLAENTKKNQFLQNVGFQNARPRSSEQNTEIELEAEKRTNAEVHVRWLIYQRRCKNLSRQGLLTERR